jgi:hypothetical protein
MDIGIYHFKKNGKFDISVFENEIINKVIQSNNFVPLSSVIEENKKDGIRAIIHKIQPTERDAKPGSARWKQLFQMHGYQIPMITENGNFVEGEFAGYYWDYYNNNQHKKPEGSPISNSIRFNSFKEAKNFENSLNTKFW